MAQAFWRPIEITSANDSFTFTDYSATPHSLSIARGVYANVWSLMHAVADECRGVSGYSTYYAYLGSDNKIVVGHSIYNSTIDFADLGEILGFDGTTSSAMAHTADYTPSHCWFPTYNSFDGGRWATRQADAFYGSRAADGTVSGVAPSTPLLERTFRFSTEPSVNVYEEDGLSEWEIARCYEFFMRSVRSVSLSGAVEDHSNCNPRGVYYINRIEDWHGLTPVLGFDHAFTAGGNRFSMASGADHYLFCHPAIEGPANPALTNRQTRSYHEIEFGLTSSAIPVAGWSAP